MNAKRIFRYFGLAIIAISVIFVFVMYFIKGEHTYKSRMVFAILWMIGHGLNLMCDTSIKLRE